MKIARGAGTLVVLLSLAAPSRALAYDPPPDDKPLTLGGDLVFLMPLGAYFDFAGPAVGPVFRLSHRIVPNLDFTQRVGFLYGLTEGRGHETLGRHNETQMSIVPIWAGARYFFQEPNVGVYAAAELGLNLLFPHGGEMRPRFGANAGAGYVISKALPIDLRVQLSVLNLFEDIPRDSGGERTYVGIGASVGYTFQL